MNIEHVAQVCVCVCVWLNTSAFYSKQRSTHQPLMQYVCMLVLGKKKKKQVQQLLCVLAKSLCIKYLQAFPRNLHTHLHNMTIRNTFTYLASMHEYAYNYIHTYYVVQH